MSIRKRVSADGKTIKWQARIKNGGVEIASKTFDTKTKALVWERQQKQQLDNLDWIDPSAGNETFKDAWERWMSVRAASVSQAARNTDRAAFKRLPSSVKNRPIGSCSKSQFEELYVKLLESLARESVLRYRNSYGAFFSWAKSQGLIGRNPATESKVPRGTGTRSNEGIRPFSYLELLEVSAEIKEARGQFHADVVLFLGSTGLRWGELSALRIQDVQEDPYPAVLICRSKSDGMPLRTETKSGKNRLVPLSEAALEIVRRNISGREANGQELVFPTSSGGFLSGSSWKRSAHWKMHSRGRTVHDLRHTFATVTLQELRGDFTSVQKWLGHASMKVTVDTYVHWMGPEADKAAMDRLENGLRIHALTEGSARGQALKGTDKKAVKAAQKVLSSGEKSCARYWDRTSDLFRVREARYRCANRA